MSAFKGQKYIYTNNWSPNHHWEVRGHYGAVHFHASVSKDYGVTAGLEFHHSALWVIKTGAYEGDAPHHIDCAMVGGPCWHDGTSLYASETVWPMVETYLRNGDHDAVFRLLESEYRRHFVIEKEEDQ